MIGQAFGRLVVECSDGLRSGHAIRRHQIKRQVELEQRADYFERLSIELTDPQGRAEALALSVHYAARANVLRNQVALTNFLVPETADEEKRRLDREDAE